MGAFLDVALPAFLLVFAGAAAARAGWIDEAGAKGLNAFVYYFAMPAALFRAASEGALVQGFDWRLVAAYFGPTLVLLAAVEALGRRAPDEERAITGMGACFSNNVFLGMPVIVAHMGGAAAGPMTAIIAVTTVLFIGLPVLRIETARGSQAAAAAAMGRIFANPLLVAIALGTLWALLPWRLPGPAATVIDLLAAVSAPAALPGSAQRWRAIASPATSATARPSARSSCWRILSWCGWRPARSGSGSSRRQWRCWRQPCRSAPMSSCWRSITAFTSAGPRRQWSCRPSRPCRLPLY